MEFKPNQKFQSNTFEKCFLIVLSDEGDLLDVLIHHSDTFIERTGLEKSYVERNYTKVV